jgi:hypothetical protein
MNAGYGFMTMAGKEKGPVHSVVGTGALGDLTIPRPYHAHAAGLNRARDDRPALVTSVEWPDEGRYSLQTVRGDTTWRL